MANQIKSAESFIPKNVRVGKWDKPELLAVLREHDIQLNQAAKDLFHDRRFNPCGQTKVIEIAALWVADLGFQSGATYRQLVERALELGLVECPLELGAYLRLQFLNQPEALPGQSAPQCRAPCGAITVASKPLDDTDEAPKGFYLRQYDGSSWLRGYWSGLDHIWEPEDVLVFSRGEKTG